MRHEEAFEFVKNILVEELDCNPSAVTLATRITSLDADSLDLVIIAMAVEEDLEIARIKDPSIFKTVNDIVVFVEKYERPNNVIKA